MAGKKILEIRPLAGHNGRRMKPSEQLSALLTATSQSLISHNLIKEPTMKVMVIVKANAASEAGVIPSQQLLTDMGNFNKELVKAGIMLAGEGLQPSSKGARVAFSGSSRSVIDGPFTETKELVAGFWVWKVESLQEAIDWVKRCPCPHEGDSVIEIRPMYSAEDFGDEFTPELREQEADLRAQTQGLGKLKFEKREQFVVGGLNQSYPKGSKKELQIPQQWQKFVPSLGKVPGQVGHVTYGVSWNFTPDCGFDYLAGVEVAESASLPPEFTRLVIPARRHVVFTHDENVSTIAKKLQTIHNEWMPDSGLKFAEAPLYEVYTEKFNPHTMSGGIELWLPLEA